VDTAWVRRYDGPAHGEDWATNLAVDSAGNVYVTGASMSDTGSNAQYLDFVTIKYYPNGDTAWVRRADFGGKDIPSGLGVDAQGNVYATGTNNDSRMVTVKYDPTGSRLWYEFFGSQDGANDLVVDSQGNVIVCGSEHRASSDAATVKYRPNGDTAWVRCYDWAGYEDYAQAIACGQAEALATAGFGAGATSHYDCITVMYDSSGDRLWATGYDGPNHGDDRTYCVAADSSGNIVAVGYGDNGYTTPYDYLTIKYDSAGETLWTRRYDGPAGRDDKAKAVAVDASGNVLVTGYARAMDSGQQCTTIKYGPAGEILWVAGFERNGEHSAGEAVAVDSIGCVYVAGWAAHAGTYSDCMTVKYSSSGDTLWTESYNGPGNSVDYCSAIALGADGGVSVTGPSQGDFVTIKYVQNGGVADARTTLEAESFTLFAEPSVFSSRTTVHFHTGKAATARVLVFDAEGRRVTTLASGSVRVGAGVVTWDGLDDRGVRMPAGVYLIVLESGTQRTNVKVVMTE
jgi:uncharacterized delta-60 repeat protein